MQNLENKHAARFVPIDDWLRQAGLSAGTVLRMERAGYALPILVPAPGVMLVDTADTYEWRELLRLMDNRTCARAEEFT